MLGHGAIGQFAIGQVGAATEVVTLDKWFMALSQPSRQPIGLRPSMQQFAAFNPQPFVPFSWFEPLSEPARSLPRSPAAESQFSAFHPAPSPFVATGWFMALSEPSRRPIGLNPARQQAWAGPPQLRPTPTTTVVMNAAEQFDIFLGGASTFSAPGSGEIGVQISPPTMSEIGVIAAALQPGETAVIPPLKAPASGAPATVGFGKISVRKV